MPKIDVPPQNIYVKKLFVCVRQVWYDNADNITLQTYFFLW